MILDQLMYSELIPDAIVKRKAHAAHFSNKQTQELKHNPASSFQYIYKQMDAEFQLARQQNRIVIKTRNAALKTAHNGQIHFLGSLK